MAIGVVLVVVAIGIGVEIKALLIGQSADPALEAAIRRSLEGRPEVRNIYRIISLQLGASLMVAVKAQMNASTASELVAAINRVEESLRAEFPEIQWLFFEPDVAD
jgi:divalent metal cation (Fe/Co/Zn/Cd) transporter